ncbi:MAG TPA: DUF2206 domain-containing protein [Actinospica sp.]|nr:DUF2206 domain-containing protein [Actinospica sp.]
MTNPLRKLGGRTVGLYATVIAGAVDLFADGSWPGALVTVCGLWLVLGAPFTFWLGLCRRLVTGLDAALLLCVGLALTTDFVILLGINFLPPLVGDEHPLTQVPIAAGFVLGNLLLGAFSPQCDPLPTLDALRGRMPAGMRSTALLGGLCVVLAVAGATRLNNGFGPGVSIAAYSLVAALMIWMLVKRDAFDTEALEVGVLCAAAALLLLTSLRGWLITGHDIQTEYEYFRLNLGGERWQVSLYPSAYDACISITLLPVALVHLTAISGIGVFKIVIPLLFALCPVALFRATLNAAPRIVALLSAILFVTFPTYLTDMPYLGRQEIAFVLLGSALVAATDPGGSRIGRRVVFTVLLGGIVLAHYSTSYVLIIVLLAATAADLLWRGRLKLKQRNRKRGRRAARTPTFLALWMAPLAVALALVWAGPVTHTGGQLSTTLTAALDEINGKGNQVGSGAASSSIFGGQQISDAQRLADYRSETEAATAQARAEGVFFPLATVDKYQTPVDPLPDMALTTVGKKLSAAGVPVASANAALRSGIADGLQVLIVIGLLATALARRRTFQPGRDQTVLALGALFMLALLTVVPEFSVDYGLLRAFQQGIFFFGPFMAAGLIWLLSWLRKAMVPAVCAFSAFLLLDLSGVLPQVTGGYPAQLALNNSGQYYDLYYPTQPEYDAAVWLELQVAPNGPESWTNEQTAEAESFTYSEIQSIYTGPIVADIYPAVISPTDYVFLGPETVDGDKATIIYRGGLVAYVYPMSLLQNTKNEVYSGDGVEIYR